jgi:hypothetical protein
MTSLLLTNLNVFSSARLSFCVLLLFYLLFVVVCFLSSIVVLCDVDSSVVVCFPSSIVALCNVDSFIVSLSDVDICLFDDLL